MDGVIKRVVGDKGFGFVRGEDGVEYFFHRDEMAVKGQFDTLRENVTRVTFAIGTSPKGPRANNLHVV